MSLATTEPAASSGAFSKMKVAVKPLLLGQFLSCIITVTGICSQQLANWGVNIPTSQSCLNYILLFVCYGSAMLIRSHLAKKKKKDTFAGEDETILNATEPVVHNEAVLVKEAQPKRPSIWIYIFLSFADVEANYLAVKAYQYTTITSVMLLDCFTIPCVMFLSWFFLKATYKLLHYIGVVLCLVGLALLVVSDLDRNPLGAGPSPLVGDLLCLAASVCYAISNVGEEAMVKNYDRVEFLTMLGLFGTVINVTQLLILERTELYDIQWNWKIGMLIVAFSIAMFALYSLAPIMMKISSATLMNLSLLTSDIFSIIASIYLFNDDLNTFYFISFFVIAVGLCVYSYPNEEGEEHKQQKGDLLTNSTTSSTIAESDRKVNEEKYELVQ